MIQLIMDTGNFFYPTQYVEEGELGLQRWDEPKL